jgi:hypothetical protein
MMRCAILLRQFIAFSAIALIVLSTSSAFARVIDEQPVATTAPTTQSAVVSPAIRSPSGLAATRPGGRGMATTRGATTGPTTNSSRLKFPTWGIEIVPPAGWTRMPESDFTVMAQWSPADGSQGVFRILITPMLTRSVRSVADSLAKGLNATVVDTTLDGRVAKRVQGGADGTSEIVCQREGYLIEIRCHHASAKTDELEAMRKEWRWSDIESPAKHPELRPDATPLTDQIVVQFPVSFRAWPIPPAPPGTVRYAAVDLMRQRIRREFDVEFSMPPNLQGQPLDKLATFLSEPYQRELVLKKPIGWRLIEGKDDRIISQQIVGPRPVDNPDGPPKYAKCLAVVALDKHTRLLAVFTSVADNDDDRFAFMTMAEGIIGSIRRGALALPTTAPTADAAAPNR